LSNFFEKTEGEDSRAKALFGLDLLDSRKELSIG
jgi:hypothetical protein